MDPFWGILQKRGVLNRELFRFYFLQVCGKSRQTCLVS